LQQGQQASCVAAVECQLTLCLHIKGQDLPLAQRGGAPVAALAAQ
jgi:hypothetical protein